MTEDYPFPAAFQGRVPFGGLALDLDGTLLNPELRVTPDCAALLAGLRKSGVAVHIVTGRMQPSTLDIWRACGLDGAIVTCNGAKIAVPGGATLFHSPLPREISARLADLCARRGWHLNHYVDDVVLLPEVTRTAQWYLDKFHAPVRIAPLAEILAGPPSTKLLVIPGPVWDGPAAVAGELARALREVAEVCGNDAFVTSSSRTFVEIVRSGVNKGAALRRLAELSGIPLERWVAAGDGRNDLEMIEAAGLGVAVAGGESLPREKADWIVPALWQGGLELVVRNAFALA